MFVGLPPPTCAAGGTWIGCRWRGVGDDSPPMILWSSMSLAILTGISRSIFRALDTPRSSWCLSLSAPSPFPRTTVLVPIPSQPTGEYFRGLPARPLPVGTPWPRTRWTPNRCQGPVPCPPSPFLCHARGPFAPSPKSEFSGDQAVRGWTRATGADHGTKVAVLDNHGTNYLHMIGIHWKYEIFSTEKQIDLDSSPFNAWLVIMNKYYHLSNSMSCIEDEQHSCIISKLTYDKTIEDQRAQAYVSGTNFEDLIPIPSCSPYNHFNYL